MVSKWFSNCKGGSYSDFIESFLEGDLEEMNICMNDITENVFSYYDVGNGKKWKQAGADFSRNTKGENKEVRFCI